MQVPDYIHGSIAPVFTAFNDDGTLDDAGQRNLFDFMLETGSISAYFVRSGMGQMYSFDMEDTKQIARNVCPHMAGRGPVLMGCSGVWDRNYEKRPDPKVFQEQAVELSKYAEGQGAAAVVHTIPEALVPTEGESIEDMVVRYFTAICAAVSCPVLFYQPPQTREEYCVKPQGLARMADIDNLVGGKVSVNDAYYIFELVQAVKDKEFGFIVGAETAFYAGLLAGARACIGQGTTVNPQVLAAIQDRFDAGDFDGMIEAQVDTNVLVEECPNAVDFYKTYATEKGYAVGLAARSMKSNPYMTERVPISREAYETYKRLYEQIVAKYA